MFTKKEKRMVGEGHFTIIRETERYIEFLSKNTKHCWIICKSQDGIGKPVMIYHKHSRETEYYHRHWKKQWNQSCSMTGMFWVRQIKREEQNIKRGR